MIYILYTICILLLINMREGEKEENSFNSADIYGKIY